MVGMKVKRILLYDLEGVALIVQMRSGVIYTNQVGGSACLHPEEMGVLAPFNYQWSEDDPSGSIESQLSRLLLGCERLTVGLANQVDEILRRSTTTDFATVDRARVPDSCESWVYVNIVETPEAVLSGFGECKGVLTWNNSD